jgi:hypothetical protein
VAGFRVQILGFGVWVLGFGVSTLATGAGMMEQASVLCAYMYRRTVKTYSKV